VLSVADANKDPRFTDNPLVTSTPDIHAYIGVPPVDRDGYGVRDRSTCGGG